MPERHGANLTNERLNKFSTQAVKLRLLSNRQIESATVARDVHNPAVVADEDGWSGLPNTLNLDVHNRV